jgi:SpoVK/Ycf46/Vps4 family AAA+-type ATPase
METKERLATLLRAGYAGIMWVTSEEQRAEAEISMATETVERTLFVWSATQGLVNVKRSGQKLGCEDPMEMLDAIGKEKTPVVVLRDFHPFFDSPMIVRKVRDLLRVFRAEGGAIIFLGPVQKIPTELTREITLLPTGLPDAETLGRVLDGVVNGVSGGKVAALDTATRDKVLGAAAGLTTIEAENAFALSLVETAKTGKATADPGIVTRQKIETLKKSGILEYYPAVESIENIGGLATLKDWLRKRTKTFTKDAAQYGLPAPKGILLAGPPGTGKSLTAKATSSMWGLPVLRLDVGKVFQPLVGQSEQTMREAIDTAEAMSPCILWLDELEKAFAGAAGGGQYDSGVGSRVFGTFLTWMSEKTSPVFVMATANNVTSLPPELIRKGRFDEIFALDLPTADEREAILAIHLAKRKRNPGKFDIKVLAAEAEEFSGAELESCVVGAMYSGFEAGREFSTADVAEEIRATTPLARSMKEVVGRMRDWARTYARPAGQAQGQAEAKGRRATV